MGIMNFFGRLLGNPEIGLSKTERARILNQSPYVIGEYHTQGMALVAYLIFDPSLPPGKAGTFPPKNLVKQINAEHGKRGRRLAEDWIIHNYLLAAKAGKARK